MKIYFFGEITDSLVQRGRLTSTKRAMDFLCSKEKLTKVTKVHIHVPVISSYCRPVSNHKTVAIADVSCE